MSPANWVLFVFGFFIVYYFLVVRRRRILVEPSPVDQLRASQQARNVVDDIELRLLEFHREVDAKAQNKIVMLHGLLDEVERKSAELRELLAKAERLRQDA